MRLICLVALPTVIAVFSGRASLAGLGILLVCKLVAVGTMSIGRRGEANADYRILRIEALTLGAMIAFVATLALGKVAEVPRSVFLLDWLATMVLVAIGRPGVANSARQKTLVGIGPQIESEPLPEVMAAIRGHVVMLCLPEGTAGNALIDQVEAQEPSGWILSGGDSSRIARLGSSVIRLEEESRRLRDIFATFRPDVVIQVLDPKWDEEVRRANTTRLLVNEALRAGVQSFVLVTPEIGRGVVSSLSERIVGALARLTRSRLVRVRLGDDIEAGAAARRILRIAAKARDGTIISLGKTSGSCMEKLAGDGTAADLWAELDQIRRT